MTSEQFWQIIEATQAPKQEEQLELFKGQLQRFSAQELIEFERIFVEHSFAAYSWDLWLVAWLCQGGMCSDDGFMDFRAWLISRGRATYETALADADSLVDEMRQTEHPEFELFGYVPSQTYRALTGTTTITFDPTLQLPEEMRQQILDARSTKFQPEYQELVEDYFRSLSEAAVR